MLGMSDNGMTADDNRVLPFTDDDADEIKDNLEDELNDLDAAQ